MVVIFVHIVYCQLLPFNRSFYKKLPWINPGLRVRCKNLPWLHIYPQTFYSSLTDHLPEYSFFSWHLRPLTDTFPGFHLLSYPINPWKYTYISTKISSHIHILRPTLRRSDIPGLRRPGKSGAKNTRLKKTCEVSRNNLSVRLESPFNNVSSLFLTSLLIGAEREHEKDVYLSLEMSVEKERLGTKGGSQRQGRMCRGKKVVTWVDGRTDRNLLRRGRRHTPNSRPRVRTPSVWGRHQFSYLTSFCCTSLSLVNPL